MFASVPFWKFTTSRSQIFWSPLLLIFKYVAILSRVERKFLRQWIQCDRNLNLIHPLFLIVMISTKELLGKSTLGKHILCIGSVS